MSALPDGWTRWDNARKRQYIIDREEQKRRDALGQDAGLATPVAKAVPVEPTEGMLSAARDWSVKKYGIGIGNDAAVGCWQAMLAAAPEAPAADEFEDRLAAACIECEVPDSTYEALCIALGLAHW